jgi:hypothetical protein
MNQGYDSQVIDMPETSSLDEESLKEIFKKHYTKTSKDAYPGVKFANKKRLVLQKKPLVLPRVLKKEHSRSLSSYEFVEADSIETFLDEQDSPRLIFETNDNLVKNSNKFYRNNNNNNGAKATNIKTLIPMLNTEIAVPSSRKVAPPPSINKRFLKEKGTFVEFGLGHKIPDYNIKAKIKDGKRSCNDLVDEQKMNKFTHDLAKTVDKQGQMLDNNHNIMNEIRKDVSKAYLLLMKQRGGSMIL